MLNNDATLKAGIAAVNDIYNGMQAGLIAQGMTAAQATAANPYSLADTFQQVLMQEIS